VALVDLTADLHIHTCLSPCADWGMSPRRIVARARELGLGLIAICDHNSAENVAAVMQVGREAGLPVLPGLEVCSREEVHLLTLFDTADRALALQAAVYARLPGVNRPELFGHQIVATAADEVLAENPRLLIGACGLTLDEVIRAAHALGGVCLPAHVDRPANGLLQQLGFIPPGLALDGVEVSSRMTAADACARWPELRELPCIRSSDAHALEDIGRARTVLRLGAPTAAELRLALQGREGRGVTAIAAGG
jgi:predicted metal-dependent phosphoesterase TrpH